MKVVADCVADRCSSTIGGLIENEGEIQHIRLSIKSGVDAA